MKTLYKFIIILMISIINYGGCLSSDDDDVDINDISMEAAIHTDCLSTINFSGDDVYAYKLTDPNFGTYWQVGGHPDNASNEMPDLGANIFATTDGTYEVSSDWGLNKVFIYYIDADGNQYASTDNNTLTVDFDEDNPRSVTFNNILVYSATLDKTLCINNVTISY